MNVTIGEREQIREMIRAWRRLRATPVVDDDFPDMMERFELELARVERMVK